MDFFDKQLEFNKIIFRDKFYYPQEINSSIDKLSSYLKNNKNSNSPFVYLFAQNHIKTIIAYFAIIKSNKICVLVDPELKHIELGEMRQDTPPYAMINYNKMSEKLDYENEIKFTDNNIDVDSKQLEDVCTMVYTNAEDGFAKAAMLTRKNIVSNAQASVPSDNVNENKTCSAFLSFSHMFGLQTGILTPLYGNASLLIVDIKHLKKLRECAKDINKYNVTNFYTIPIIYYLLEKISTIQTIVKNVERFCSGGYRLNNSIRDPFQNKTEKIIYEGYGLTETSPVCSWYRPGDQIRPNSVGRNLPCCQIKILNENNNEYPIGQVGEICIKGENVMKGYYNKIEATNKVLKNGWLHTGDLGKIDKDGYIYLTGMKKNMFKVTGKNVYPHELERLIKINTHVKSIKIYGELSEINGCNIKAKVEFKNEFKESTDTLRKWCLENISHYKIPQFINSNL